MNMVDKLVERILQTKNPSVVGLDPDIKKIPACYKISTENEDPFRAVARVFYEWNRDVIDAVYDLIPAVKPQMAFYEKYGAYGVVAFEKTVAYAKSKGLLVIEDAKRNDIGNTANAYADGHLGMAELPDGSLAPVLDADFLTVTPFLGSESLYPFIDACKKYDKGIFVLVKTSNEGSGELQDAVTANGLTVSERLATFVCDQAEALVGSCGYSPIGAVVGATYPEEADALRKIMPKSYFLVPGYGAQGGSAEDILPCFHADGLGAVVNSSRGILYMHMSDEERARCTRKEYSKKVREAVLHMRRDIHDALKTRYPDMIY